MCNWTLFLLLCFPVCLFACLFVGNGRIYERWSPIVALRKKRSQAAPRHFFGRSHLSKPGHIMSMDVAAGMLVLSPVVLAVSRTPEKAQSTGAGQQPGGCFFLKAHATHPND